MSEVEEAAKAVQEIAKLGAKTIESLERVEEVGRKLLGPFGQAYGILTDIVAYKREEIRWRLANKLAIYQRVTLKLNKQSHSIDDLRAVPPRIAHDYEDALEREDDPTLQDLWAQLLVNVTAPDSAIFPRKSYKDILTRLDKDMALLFNEIGRRRSSIRMYYIVCGTSDGGVQLGIDRYNLLVPKPIESTEIFEYSEEEDVIYCNINENRFECMIDELVAAGILAWETELHRASDLLEIDENLEPSADNIQFGKKILQNATGIRVFKISGLGREFWKAISEPRE